MNPRALGRALRGLTAARGRSETAIVAYQEACLRHLVQHTYANVPYYRRRLRATGVEPKTIRTLRDLATLPITTRHDLQSQAASDTCAVGGRTRSLRVVTTSGSTGAPLTVRRTYFEERLLLAFRLRALQQRGLPLRWRRATIDYFGPGSRHLGRRRPFYEHLGLLPRLSIDWRTPKSEIVSQLARFRPDAVTGPPSILAWLADELTHGDRQRVPLRIVVSGGETLTPDLSERIQRGFGAAITDVYGCYETIFIASRGARAEPFRVCREAVIVEVLRDGRPVAPGESGEIVVTALHQYAMPFLRYRLGDLVTAAEVAGAGETVSGLHSIDGREMERFLLPDGRIVHPYTFSDLVQESGLPVRRFQVIQQKRDDFLIRLVLLDGSRSNLEALRSGISAALGGGIRVRTEWVEALHPVAGSKFRTYLPVERLKAGNP